MVSQFLELWVVEERPLMMLEQLYLARMDLSLHSVYKTDAAQTILTHRLEIARGTLVLPFSSNNCDFCTLMHLFGDEYEMKLFR
ncbi:hypothetical protein H632_c2442p0 [Helicosporidium sp. ATCC 50920]|nr:hypothetical protein H632_c2442p0 [Helicosporidium sp. ATCC 50920]|eukprot:KDD73192.1 hypothetical protein H632_c2442p0 [Helicosporidium sp. ATCC 50920]